MDLCPTPLGVYHLRCLRFSKTKEVPSNEGGEAKREATPDTRMSEHPQPARVLKQVSVPDLMVGDGPLRRRDPAGLAIRGVVVEERS